MRSIARKLLPLTVLGLIVGISGSPLEVKQQHLDDAIAPTAVADLNYRLSYDVLPSNYKIQIEPFFANVNWKITRKSL
jgi:hypothetical protein